VPLGYIAACVAAGLIMALALFGTGSDPEFVSYFIASVAIMTFWAGSVAFVPMAIVIVLAEAFAWRSMIFYLLVGGSIGLAGDQIAAQYGLLEFTDQRLAILLAAGFVGGFAYWLIAGRLSGVTPPPRPPAVPAP